MPYISMVDELYDKYFKIIHINKADQNMDIIILLTNKYFLNAGLICFCPYLVVSLTGHRK